MKHLSDVYAQVLLDQLVIHTNANKLAIVWEDQNGTLLQLTYQALQEKALKQAINLQSLYSSKGKGQHGESRIGVWLPRTADYVITFLSIWMSGGVYVPITDASLQRLEENADFRADFEKRVRALDPNVDAIISDSAGIEILQTLTTVKLININDLSLNNANHLKPTPRNLQSEAFVYCSSGTTGPPKMIALPYEGIADRVHSVTEELGISSEDSVLNYTGFDFDPSLMEIIMAVQLGCPLIMAPEYARTDPRAIARFYEKLDAQRILRPNFAIIVPSMLKVMDPNIFGDLKGLMTTGENITLSDLELWFNIPNINIFTGYGPTETTWGATLTKISRDLIHITQPMRGIQLFVVPSADSEIGMHEILIGGNGQGVYIGENAEANTQKNWIEYQGQRCFNPHDGVFIEAEKLIYCGRIDDVIKYHGKWISLETLDAISESHPAVEFATTVSISGSSLIFVFLVSRGNLTLTETSVATHFRSKISGELFPVFFQVPKLKFNSRGKRCRSLKDYQDCVPLSTAQVTSDPLALLWTLALTEISLAQIESAFFTVGIKNYHDYLPQYEANDRFDAWGGRSLKLTRLVTLLWNEYIKVDNKSHQTFQIGILQHQTLREMSLFVQLYQAVIRSAIETPSSSCPSFRISLAWEFPDDALPEYCELLETEIKTLHAASFYHLIIHSNSAKFLMALQTHFRGRAIIDEAHHLTSSQEIEKRYLHHFIKTRLCQSPIWGESLNFPVISMHPDSNRTLTLLGSACGKTAFLKKRHEELIQQGKSVCIISCRNLNDEENNLQTYFSFSPKEWETLCQAEDILSEITWLIDDIDIGFHRSRFQHLQNNLKAYSGKSHFIYAGRENVYPFLKEKAEFGKIELLSSDLPADLDAWFRSEAKRVGQTSSEFYSQLTYCVEQVSKEKYIPAESPQNWWAFITPDLMQKRLDQPPLFLSQFPCFSSLVRFLTLHDTMVYSLKRDNRFALQQYLSTYLSYSTPAVPVSPNSNHAHPLPPHIRHFPGDPWLSPWIFFHSISGECPEGYEFCAEMIVRQTRQSVYSISLPQRQTWETLSDQVSTYLDQIADAQLVPAGASYYLLGWSYGGYLATEAARQLEVQGKSVAVVVNLDAAPIFGHLDFSWENHLEYVKQYIPVKMLQRTHANLIRLQHYCQPNEMQKIKAMNYIFYATVQPDTMREVAMEEWKTRSTSVELIPCKCDHFGIFSDPTFRTQFQKIINSCTEQPDLRPLALRLEEMTKANSQTQKKLNSTAPAYFATELDLRIQKEFLNRKDAPSCLIIEGVPGIGKSRLVNHLAQELLWGDEWTPIVIPLRRYSRIRDFNTVLQRHGISPSDLRQSKTLATRLLFIIDAFDEGDLDLIAYPITVLHECVTAKLIITVRKGMLSSSQLRGIVADTWELPLLEGEWLEPWLEKFDSDTPDLPIYPWLQQPETLRSLLESKQRDLSWLRTPLSLSMLLTLHQSGHNLERLIDNPFELYRTIDDTFLAQNSVLLEQSGSDFKSSYQRYTETLILEDTGQHQLPWNYTDAITQAFKKSAQLLEQQGRLSFPHSTWRDYHLANTLINAVLNFTFQGNRTQLSPVFYRFKLVDLPKTSFLITLLLNFWNKAESHTQSLLRKNLFTIVFLSRRFKGANIVTRAASMAMEMLNIFQISCAGIDFSGIDAPECDLSGGIFSRSNFRLANLRGVFFTNAALNEANFQDATLERVEYGELPKLRGNAAAYSPEGDVLILADEGTLTLYDTQEYRPQWSGQVSKLPIRRIFSSQNVIIAHTDHELIRLNRMTLDNSPQIVSYLEKIDDILLSPQGTKIAILFPIGVELRSIDGSEPAIWFDASDTEFSENEALTTFPQQQRLAINHSGSEIAAVIQSQLYIWLTASTALITIDGIKNEYVHSVAYHPTKDILIACSTEIYIINSATHTLIRQTMVFGYMRFYLAFDPHDHIIISDGLSVYRYSINEDNDAESGIDMPCNIDTVKLSPTGRHLAVTRADPDSDTHLYVVNLTTLQIDRRFDLPPTNDPLEIEYHPSGMHLTVLSPQTKVIHLCPLTVKPCLQQVVEQNRFNSRKFIGVLPMPQKSSLLISLEYKRFILHPHSRICTPFIGSEVPYDPIAIRRDEHEVAVPSVDNTLVLHQVSGEARRLNLSAEGIIHILYVPPEEKKIIITTYQSLCIIDTLQEICEHRIEVPVPIHVVITADGEVVALRSIAEIVIFQRRDPTLRSAISVANVEPRCLRTHPDKKQIVTSDNVHLILINVTSHPYQTAKLSHLSKVEDVCYRPHRDELACLTEDGNIYFWNTNSLKCLQTSPLQSDRFKQLKYTPRGDYLALAGNSLGIQFWDAESRQCIQEIAVIRTVRQLDWLISPFNNSRQEILYYLSSQENNNGIEVYEIAVKANATLEVSLVWGTSRSSSLSRIQAIPDDFPLAASNTPSTSSTKSRQNYFPLEILLKFSDFLNYRDYCHFVAALEIPSLKLLEHAKRPVFEPLVWKKRAPQVGEQLQRLGFFALQRPADIHHLTLTPSDRYQSVIISEENGIVCGEIDVHHLNNMLQYL